MKQKKLIKELRSIFEKNNIHSKLKNNNQKMLENNFWQDKTNSQKIIKEKGGFISAHWDGTNETEEAIKKKTKATIRCIPLETKVEEGVCVFSGKPSKQRVLFAKSY